MEVKTQSKISRRILVVGSNILFIIKQARKKNAGKLSRKGTKARFPGTLRLKVRNIFLFY